VLDPNLRQASNSRRATRTSSRRVTMNRRRTKMSRSSRPETRPGWPLPIRGERGPGQTETRKAPSRGNPLNEAGFLPGHKTASSASQPAETFRADLHPREAQTQTTYDRERKDANHEPDHGREEEGVRRWNQPEHGAATHADSSQDHEEGPTGGDADDRPLLRFCPTNTCQSHAHHLSLRGRVRQLGIELAGYVVGSHPQVQPARDIRLLQCVQPDDSPVLGDGEDAVVAVTRAETLDL